MCRSLVVALLAFVDTQACTVREDFTCESVDIGALHLLQKAAALVQKSVEATPRHEVNVSMQPISHRSAATLAFAGFSQLQLQMRASMNPLVCKFPWILIGGMPKLNLQVAVDPPSSMYFINYLLCGFIAATILGLIVLTFKACCLEKEGASAAEGSDSAQDDYIISKYVGMLLAAVDANDWMVFTFFPAWCVERGLSETKAGIIMALLGVGLLVMAPFTKYYMGIPSEPNRTLWLGSRCYAVTRILCLVLLFIPTNVLFPAACVVFLITGMCWAVTEVSAAAWVLTSVSGDKRVAAMGCMLGGRMLGSIIGPALGGILFDIGGLWLPICFGFFLLLAVQQYGKSFFHQVVEYQETKAFARGSILRHIPVLISTLVYIAVNSVFVSQVMWQEIWMLQRYHMNLWQYGLVFTFLMVLMGSFMSGVVANVDKIIGTVPATIFGLLIVSSGYLIIGPSPLLPFLSSTEVWIPVVGTMIWAIGICFPMVILSSFVTNISIGAGWSEMDASIQWATIQIILTGVSITIGPPFFTVLIAKIGVGYMCTTIAFVMTCCCGGLMCLLFCVSYTDASLSPKTSDK